MDLLVKKKLPSPVYICKGDSLRVSVTTEEKTYVVATKDFTEDKGVFDTAFIAEGENMFGMRKVLFGGFGLE